MAQDLAALAPSAIVCAAFIIGAGFLLRRELAPKRRARAEREGAGDQSASEHDEGSES